MLLVFILRALHVAQMTELLSVCFIEWQNTAPAACDSTHIGSGADLNALRQRGPLWWAPPTSTLTTTTTARGDNLGTLYAQDFNFNNNTFNNGDCNYGRWNGCGQV